MLFQDQKTNSIDGTSTLQPTSPRLNPAQPIPPHPIPPVPERAPVLVPGQAQEKVPGQAKKTGRAARTPQHNPNQPNPTPTYPNPIPT